MSSSIEAISRLHQFHLLFPWITNLFCGASGANELVAAPTKAAQISGIATMLYERNELAMVANEGIIVPRFNLVVFNIVDCEKRFLGLDSVRGHGESLIFTRRDKRCRQPR